MIKIERIGENEFLYQENENDPIVLKSKLDKKTQRYAIRLPENELNRKWVQESMVDKNGGEIIINEYKESRHLSQSSKKSSNWVEYLDENEKSIIDEIKERAVQRAKDAQRAKIEAEIKRLQEMLK